MVGVHLEEQQLEGRNLAGELRQEYVNFDGICAAS